MANLPLLISVPHAGLQIPPELVHLNRLTPEQIAEEAELDAREIFDILEAESVFFSTSEIASVFVDLDRAESDLDDRGVVKAHTRTGIPIYSQPLSSQLIETLLDRYHRPYHRGLSQLAGRGVVLAVDCHVMNPGKSVDGTKNHFEQPQVTLCNGNNCCPPEWLSQLQSMFQAHFPGRVDIASSRGGYITAAHRQEMPWVRLEICPGEFAGNALKSLWVVESLRAWCQLQGFILKAL